MTKSECSSAIFTVAEGEECDTINLLNRSHEMKSLIFIYIWHFLCLFLFILNGISQIYIKTNQNGKIEYTDKTLHAHKEKFFFQKCL